MSMCFQYHCNYSKNAISYVLPKIHKPNNSCRPIVTACSCHTELISSCLGNVISPLVKKLPSYVKDTNHTSTDFISIAPIVNKFLSWTSNPPQAQSFLIEGVKKLKFLFDQRAKLVPSLVPYFALLN